MLLVPHYLASVPFPLILGGVSQGSQMPLVQHIGFGRVGATLLRRSWDPHLHLQELLLADTGYKGLNQDQLCGVIAAPG